MSLYQHSPKLLQVPRCCFCCFLLLYLLMFSLFLLWISRYKIYCVLFPILSPRPLLAHSVAQFVAQIARTCAANYAGKVDPFKAQTDHTRAAKMLAIRSLCQVLYKYVRAFKFRICAPSSAALCSVNQVGVTYQGVHAYPIQSYRFTFAFYM